MIWLRTRLNEMDTKIYKNRVGMEYISDIDLPRSYEVVPLFQCQSEDPLETKNEDIAIIKYPLLYMVKNDVYGLRTVYRWQVPLCTV